MRNPPTVSPRSLPETLLSDLQELLTWENNCLLTWVSIRSEADPTGLRWFTVKYSSDGREFGLRLEFWVPEWMNARAVAAILPAHLAVADCDPGKQAAVDLGMGAWSALQASLPRVARTCARLINELWGRTEAEQVLLLTIEQQEEQLETPFTELPTYDG
jgi:hypothetical protein